MSDRYPSVRLEGGLLSVEVIDEVAAGSLSGQRPADFGFPGSRPFIDEVAPIWAEALAQWKTFRAAVDRLPPEATAARETRDRWVGPLLSLLGYDLYRLPRAVEVDGLSFAFSHRSGPDENAPPVHIVGCRQSLDRRPESGRPRLGPHSLVQEFLNRTEALWGMATNGLVLRLLRDSHLIRRQSYVEFDLARMMEEERFADFALFVRLLHATRLPRTGEDVKDCFLERYHRTTVEQGGRVRDHLRDGVEKALGTIGDGLLAHPANDALRARVASGELSPFDYYQQLLKLIYRLLFLAVSEERGLVSDDTRYRDHYSISRLRRLAEVRAAYSDQRDLWEGLGTTFRLFGDERAGVALNVPILNGDLFDVAGLADLAEGALPNRTLLSAIWDLSMYREKERAPWRRINYGALDVEELGSVYESLLDFAPVFGTANGRPSFALSAGTERKSTGSYYTPPELVNELVQSALVPVIADRLAAAKSPKEKEQSLLSLSVCDPACGSGHFLLAAARRIGREVARARTGDEEPSPEAQRLAVRDAITHCIYGVDKNPLAVDLCRVALWLEGHSMGRPLTFLDHRIRCGDSLVGVYDLSVLTDGIPDEAYTAVTGDDKAVARDMKRQNKLERSGQTTLTAAEPVNLGDLNKARSRLYTITDDTPAEVQEKALAYRTAQAEGTPWFRDRTACDLWTAAFFAPLIPGMIFTHSIPTTETVRRYLAGDPATVSGGAVRMARILSRHYRFFHWPLEFPEVFAKGGFDCVLGNPPWDMVMKNSDEFFSQFDPSFRSLNIQGKNTIMNELCKDPEISNQWEIYCSTFYHLVHYFKNSPVFSYQGGGHHNLFKLFLEKFHQISADKCNFGLIIPSGIYTDEGCTDLRKMLFDHSNLISLFCFENRNKIFPIDSRFKFVVLVAKKGGTTSSFISAFMVHDLSLLSGLHDDGLRIPVPLISKLSPDTISIMEFKDQQEIDLISKIYTNRPLLGDKLENSWNLDFHRELHVSEDQPFFQDSQTPYEVYEGKMIFQYNHKFELPRFWMTPENITKTYAHQKNPPWKHYRLAYRAVASNTNEVTLISTILPKDTASVHSLMVLELFDSVDSINKKVSNSEQLFLVGLLNSFVLNFIIRKKVTSNVSVFLVLQLPVPKIGQGDWYFDQIIPRVARLICFSPDFSEYWNEVFSSEWVQISSIDGGTSKLVDWKNLNKNWDNYHGIQELDSTKHDIGDRAQLHCEIDALVAHLYGISRGELEYILSTFPGVKQIAPWLIEGTLLEYDRMKEFVPTKHGPP